MEVHRHAWPDPLTNLPDQEFGRFRTACADRVDDYYFGGAGFERSQINSLEEIQLTPRAIDGKERDLDAVLLGR
jgi:hypothetical protein